MIINPSCFVIAVAGGKGGVGKSTFAVNLASAISTELKTQVLLMDADQNSAGDLQVLLGVRPVKNMNEIAQFSGALTPANFNTVLTMHPSGSIALIPAVKGPEESLQVSPDAILKQLEVFSRHFKYLVIDIGHQMTNLQKALLDEATAVCLIATPEILVVNQTQKLMNELLSATYPLEMMQLVLNKNSNMGLTPQMISQNLRLPILAAIPADEASAMGALQKSVPFVLGNNRAPISQSYHELVRRLTGGILQKLKTSAKSSGTGIPMGIDGLNVLKVRIHNELIKAMELDKKSPNDNAADEAKDKALRQKALQVLSQIVDREAPAASREERSKIIKEVIEEALGLGALEDLLADPTVTEIMVNGHKKIYIERNGKVQLSGVTFTSNQHLRNVIERIVTPLGRRIDEKTPYVDARLKDGSRVNAVIEPLAIDGPAVTIRKFKKGGISGEKYIEFGSATKAMIDFLKICVENGLNIVISGGTGSGKTSLLNMLSSYIPATDRIVTVEDAAELQMQQDHVVRLETRPANMEGTGAITIRDLIRNALRMRPDRIIVGETRDGAALDMLQAMNTGHDGSMTTTHANNPRECIARLETLCLMAGMELPMKAIREQIASAVQLIVQISRLSDGSRKIMSITEVAGMQGEVVTLAEIFKFKETGQDKNRRIEGVFRSEGHIPTFIEKLEKKGVIIPRDIFSGEVKVGGGGSAAIPASGSAAKSVPGAPNTNSSPASSSAVGTSANPQGISPTPNSQGVNSVVGIRPPQPPPMAAPPLSIPKKTGTGGDRS